MLRRSPLLSACFTSSYQESGVYELGLRAFSSPWNPRGRDTVVGPEVEDIELKSRLLFPAGDRNFERLHPHALRD